MARATKKAVVILLNKRNYNPPEYEAWCESEVIAHSQDLDSLVAKYPQATYPCEWVGHRDAMDEVGFCGVCQQGTPPAVMP